MSFSVPKMLVYIPTYLDHHLAANQARALRAEFKSAKLSLWVVISVNGVNLSPKEIQNLEDSCDRLVIFNENLGGDTNINLGFLLALQESANFLWILSANDNLVNGAGHKMQLAIENLTLDFLIIGKPNKGLSGSLTNAFSEEGLSLPLGLISAVVYRTEVFKEAFANSLKFAWTGWGQLSVIQNTLFDRKVLKYALIDEMSIYERTPKASKSEQREKNQSNYRHSFFGYPLLISLLFEVDRKSRNNLIQKWLRVNWYKIGYFKNGHSPYLDRGHTARDAFWTGPLAKPYILKSGLTSPILYLFGLVPFLAISQRFLPITKLQKILLQKLKGFSQ